MERTINLTERAERQLKDLEQRYGLTADEAIDQALHLMVYRLIKKTMAKNRCLSNEEARDLDI